MATDQTVADELERDQRPRPPWWRRVEVVELLELEAGNPAARPRSQLVRQGGIIVGPAARRRAAAGSPVPPRRERPPDLEATAQGVQLYGPRRAVPAPYQLAGPTSSTPADTTGTKLAYRPLEGRPARVTGIRLHLPAASAGMVAAVQLLRGGATHELYRTAAGGELEVDTDLVLEPGDELRVEVLTAGAAGTTLVSHISAEAWT